MSGNALHTGMTLALAVSLLALGPRTAPAQGAAPAAPGTAPPDTGWVEVGGAAGPGERDPFADLPSAEDEGPVEPEGGHLLPYLTYNRVDQFTIGIDMTYKPTRGWNPELSTRIARALRRQDPTAQGDGRWLYDVRLEQPIDPQRRGHVGIASYRRTDDDEFGQVGDVENALAAMFFHWDYKDWFEREGYGLNADYTFRDRWRGSVRYDQDAYRSITKLAVAGSVFRSSADWRENPAIDDGNLRSVTFGLDYDTRSNKKTPRRGMYHQLRAETAGGDLGGDFGYRRYSADLRAYFSPGPAHLAKVRGMFGTTAGTDPLPFQKTWAIGGIGTLRGSTFREFRGRQLFLSNADWAWEVFKRSSRNAMVKTGLSLVAFTDFGLAWDAPTYDLGRQKPAWDAGFGLGTTDETFRVYFARDLRADHGPLHVTVRVSRSY